MNTLTLARLTELRSSAPGDVGGDPAALDQVDLVEVRAEEQERGQRRGADRVALGQRLGRVADGVERSVISRAPSSIRLNSTMPPALSVIGPKVSIARM